MECIGDRAFPRSLSGMPARANVTVPSTVLALADEVIE